jgi:hypothetical protein
MLNLYKLEQFQVKNKNGIISICCQTSTNIVQYNEIKLQVQVRAHDKTRRDYKYIYSYYDLEKFALNTGSYIPSFATLLKLFNDVKK